MSPSKKVYFEEGRPMFQGRRISRRDAQKIKYGGWADYSDEEIHKKLNDKLNRRDKIEGFHILYEELLKTPEGQFSLGIAQEKTANEIIRVAKQIIIEGRRMVKACLKKNKESQDNTQR